MAAHQAVALQTQQQECLSRVQPAQDLAMECGLFRLEPLAVCPLGVSSAEQALVKIKNNQVNRVNQVNHVSVTIAEDMLDRKL
jgi:hypothetical protein